MKALFITAAIAIALFRVSVSVAQLKSDKIRHIDIACLIVDSETLNPIRDAVIYDRKGQQLAIANSAGYLKVTLAQTGEGEMKFSFKIGKEGYTPLLQKEHWGDLGDQSSAIYYIGLKKHKSRYPSFSEMETGINDLSYESVSNNIKNVREQIVLEHKIEDAKKNNDHVFFEIDHHYYLVNNTGWIELKTNEDKIQIGGKEVVSANQINSVVKRNKVKGMTPIVSDVASFAISF